MSLPCLVDELLTFNRLVSGLENVISNNKPPQVGYLLDGNWKEEVCVEEVYEDESESRSKELDEVEGVSSFL